MADLNNSTRELSSHELDAVTGGGAIVEAMGTAYAIGAAVGAIGGINHVLTAAVDGIPPAPCHPK
jgi:hypothetical protein